MVAREAVSVNDGTIASKTTARWQTELFCFDVMAVNSNKGHALGQQVPALRGHAPRALLSVLRINRLVALQTGIP